MKAQPPSSPAQVPASTLRRRFIVESLTRINELPLSSILAKFPETASQSIKDDIEHLIGIGFRIVKKRSGREVILVNDSSTHNDVKDYRAGVRLIEKSLAAGLTLAAICGYPFADNEETKTQSDGSPAQSPIWRSPLEIHKLLEKCGKIERHCRQEVAKVHRLLQDFWAEHNRSIFLDSGTTNERIADFLIDLQLPSQTGNLGRLSVATNDAAIFHKIGNTRCPVRSTIVGGQKRGRSDTIAGAIAETFLRCANLQFGLSVIGSTIVDLNSFYACSDTQEEASLKAIVLEKSSLKVICVDNSKLSFRPMRTSYPYAALRPDQIDLIVTNCPRSLESFEEDDLTPLEIDEHQRSIDEFPLHVRSILKRGIPVLMAESLETEAIDSLFDPGLRRQQG